MILLKGVWAVMCLDSTGKKGKSEENALLELVEPDDLISYGLIPELIGRLHMISTLSPITKEAMVENSYKAKKRPCEAVSKDF